MSKIITVHEYPPIPMRDYDWCAYRYGQEELGNYGWGKTELEAVHDLLQIEAEDRAYEAFKNKHGELKMDEPIDWESMKPPSQIFGR